MNKRTAVIGVMLSLLPFGQALFTKTSGVLSASVLMLLIPNEAKSESFDFYKEGNKKFHRRDYQGAIFDYTKEIEINDQSWQAYYQRGSSKYMLEDYQGAISDFKRSIKINPSYSNSFVYLAISLNKFNNEREDDALRYLTKAIKLDKNNIFAYSNRARIKFSIEDYQGAIFDYTKAIELAPTNGGYYYFRGNAKELLNNIGGACKDWRVAADHLGHLKAQSKYNIKCSN